MFWVGRAVACPTISPIKHYENTHPRYVVNYCFVAATFMVGRWQY